MDTDDKNKNMGWTGSSSIAFKFHSEMCPVRNSAEAPTTVSEVFVVLLSSTKRQSRY
jgi:hypothetical protein